jgi:phosphoribosylformylglycinamidine synthase PurS subunit
VARYVVDVMPKREILDPQGKAVLGALPRLGFEGVTEVRQGKRFEVELDGDPTDDGLAEVRRMAETLLANPVIEDFTVHTGEPVSSAEPVSSVEPVATTAEDPA